MKKLAAVLLATALTACFGHPSGEAATNDSAAMATGQFAVDTVDQLPDCDTSMQNYSAFVIADDHVVKCDSGAWTAPAQVN